MKNKFLCKLGFHQWGQYHFLGAFALDNHYVRFCDHCKKEELKKIYMPRGREFEALRQELGEKSHQKKPELTIISHKK
jgi:hypothetical protein